MNKASKEDPKSKSDQVSSSAGGRSNLQWAWLVLPVAYLWFHLIDDLRPEWSTNPQYSYGLMVPILLAGLLLRRWQRLTGTHAPSPVPQFQPVWRLCWVLAVLFLPIRLIEAANPEWRPLQWVFAMDVVGLTLGCVYLAGGRRWLGMAAFPVAFFLVAVPWPSPIEQPIIQSLSRANATMVVEVLNVLDIPAVQHGNVIEVGTGMVGVNDACSGIRSLQSSLMISLFLGEFYFLAWSRRLMLVPLSILLAMMLNLCRTSILTGLASKKGIAAIAEYHDETGMTILMICTVLLWAIAWIFSRVKPAPAAAAGADHPEPAVAIGWAGATRLGFCLVIWLVVVESGVELWYRAREARLVPGPDWTVKMPEDNPTFKTLPFTHDEHVLLRFDEGSQGSWHDRDGTGWEVYYYNWLPGRVAGYLAKRHTPDICLPAVGLQMLSGPELSIINVKGIYLPARHYEFSGSPNPLQVFQIHWEAGLGTNSFTARESSRFNFIRSIWAGRGNHGQKVLEVIISDSQNADQAKQALIEHLNDLIQVQPVAPAGGA